MGHLDVIAIRVNPIPCIPIVATLPEVVGAQNEGNLVEVNAVCRLIAL